MVFRLRASVEYFGLSLFVRSLRMLRTRKHLNPVHNTPPKADEKHTKEIQEEIYLICDLTIIESKDDVVGDDAVYCEGECKAWLHCKCVCMSKLFYDKLSKSDDLYYCPNCASTRHSHEISELRKQIKALTDALVGVKALESKVTDLEGKLSTVRDGFASDKIIASSGSVPPTPVANSNANQQRKSGAFHDHKFNLIIRGIPECSPNTKRFEQLQLDQHKL